MQHAIKHTNKITFFNSHKKVCDKNGVRENVLTRNVVIRSSVKPTLSLLLKRVKVLSYPDPITP